MGTIAEKLTYLNDTRLKIKDGLNKFGADLTENDTFRSYSNVLNGIYNKLPKVSGNGSNFTLENVQKGKLDLFEMEGNTYQNSTSGNQLLDFDNYSSISVGISKVLFENDVLTIEQTSSGTFQRVEYNVLNFIKNNPGKKLKLSYKSLDASQFNSSNAQICQLRYINNGSTSYVPLLYKTGAQQTFSIPSDTSNITSVFICFYTNNSNTSVSNSSFTITEPLLYFDENSEYEPYTGGQPSPSPDFPQQIKVVENKQVVNVHGKNLFDKNNANIINAYISLGNSKITSSNADKCLYMPIKNNTTYTISKILSSRFVIGCVDEEPVLNSSVCNPISGNQASNTTYTITSGNNSKYLVIFYYTTSDTLIEQQILDSIQIEYGNTATPYEPYHNQDYEIDLGNIELCKIGDYKDVIFKNNQLSEYYDSTLDEDSWYIKKNIGKVVLNGSENWLYSDNTSNKYFYLSYEKKSKPYLPNSIVMSDYYKYTNNLGNVYDYAITGGNNYFPLIKNKDITSVEDFKTWLSTYNTTVYYILATPTTTEITDTTLINQLEAIETETGTNIFEVSNDNDVLPSLNVKRLKELEKLS